MSDHETNEEVLGAALAAYAVSINTVRMLKDRGVLSEADAQAIVVGVLKTLEGSDVVSNAAAHNARALLQDFAKELGVLFRSPN